MAWSSGQFDTAHRPPTPLVEGVLRCPHTLVLATLSGGARRLDVRSDCGHRFEGPDRTGAVSVVPGGAERWLRLTDVRARWASLTVGDAAFEGLGGQPPGAVTNADEPLLRGVLTAFADRLAEDGALDPLWCETMTRAAAVHLVRRFGVAAPARPARLAPWQLRRVREHVCANLAGPIAVADLAAAAGVSAGHFHRAFRATTGRTPLAYVTDERVTRALEMLAKEPLTVTTLASRVGFLSPGHFARVFRARTGRNPGDRSA